MNTKGANHNYYEEWDELKTGELVIYRNPDTKKRTWYCRIKLKERGYVRRSLKTVHKKDAVRAAWDIYNTVKEKEFFGITVKRQSLNVVVDSLIKTKKNLSKERRKQYINCTTRYILPYFQGKHLDELHDLQPFIDDYPLWRWDYWDRYDEEVKAGKRKDERLLLNKVGYKGLKKMGIKRPYSWYKSKPSRSTILAEVRMFNAIMKYAYDQKWLKRPVVMSYDNIPQTKPVRNAIYTFKEEEINKLKAYFQAQTRANKKFLYDEDGEPVLDEQGNPKYVLFPTAQPLQRRAWVNLRVAFFLQLNVGLRTSEVHNLKWSQIAYKVAKGKDGDEMPYLALTVEETKSERRTKLFRTAYCPIHMTKLLNEVREVNAPYNKDSDYVFTDGKGKKYRLLNRRFQQLLKKLGIYETDIGTTRDRGHLRSYWMAKALMTKPIHIVASASGNSIQTCYDFYTKLAVGKRAYELLEDIRQPDSIVALMTVKDTD